jgi:predicted membrane channel-forming protein YqfA (hemolysin III family)
MEIITIIIWMASIFGCYKLAVDKNRSVDGWLLLGVFFGVFALLVISILKPLPKQLNL